VEFHVTNLTLALYVLRTVEDFPWSTIWQGKSIKFKGPSASKDENRNHYIPLYRNLLHSIELDFALTITQNTLQHSSAWYFYILTSTIMFFPQIAIIGAGPGGLTLASILQRNGMKCAIFELDNDRSARDQGGIVDLHTDGGQAALKAAGLFDKFQKITIPSADSMKLMKANGEVVWDENDTTQNKPPETSRDRPEVDRTNLRDLLLDAVDPESIQWNKKLLRVEVNEDSKSKYDLHFADGTAKGFDLVIGADGAWSKVRPLVTSEMPYYSGITMVDIQAHNVSQSKPWLNKFIGQGSFFMFDEGRAIIGQQNSFDRTRIYVAVRQPESWMTDCGINWEDPESARRELAEGYFGDCHEDLKRVITDEATDGLRVWKLYMLPVGTHWKPRSGVTLLGDAAHLMTPFAGVGVNVAMADAASLAQELLKMKDTLEAGEQSALDDAVKSYEEGMFVRGKDNMRKTYHGLIKHFSADGIDERVGKLKQRAKMVEQMKIAEEMKKLAIKT
jgi:2-polyprenyl-6-methoxyphenol hydroxylase-like FAD-dependent oxidoreductase